MWFSNFFLRNFRLFIMVRTGVPTSVANETILGNTTATVGYNILPGLTKGTLLYDISPKKQLCRGKFFFVKKLHTGTLLRIFRYNEGYDKETTIKISHRALLQKHYRFRVQKELSYGVKKAEGNGLT